MENYEVRFQPAAAADFDPAVAKDNPHRLLAVTLGVGEMAVTGLSSRQIDKFFEEEVFPVIMERRREANQHSHRKYSEATLERKLGTHFESIRGYLGGMSYAAVGAQNCTSGSTAQKNIKAALGWLDSEGHDRAELVWPLLERHPDVTVASVLPVTLAQPAVKAPPEPGARARVRSRSTGERDSFGVYLNEIARVPLLDAEAEVELAKTIEIGLFAEQISKTRRAKDPAEYLEQLGLSKTKHGSAADAQIIERLAADTGLSDDELEWLIEEGRLATRHLTEANLKLVVHFARKFPRDGMSIADLTQEGTLGLIRAVRKFDYTKGYKFSTYGSWWIRQAIGRGTADQARTIRLPVHVVEELKQFDNACRRLELQLDRDPRPEEIAKELKIDIAHVNELLLWRKEADSLDRPIGEDNGTVITLNDHIAQRTIPGPDSITVEKNIQQRFMNCIDQLDWQTADIILSHNGIGKRKERLIDIAARYDINAAMVSKLEREGLDRLRRIILWQDADLPIEASL